MTANEIITVTALKYGGRPHCSQRLVLLYEGNGVRVLYGVPGDPFYHHTRGRTFIFPEAGIYCFFEDRPYVPVLIARPDSGVRLYCHAALPAVFWNGAVSYVDLEIDVLREPGGDLYVVDMDEYAEMRAKNHYPASVMHIAERAEAVVRSDVERQIFPFDDTLTVFEKHCEDFEALKRYFVSKAHI